MPKYPENTPKVNPPKMDWAFAPDPFVVGPPDLAREVWNYTNKYPVVKGKVKSVTQGPTLASIDREMAHGHPQGSYAEILGIYQTSPFQGRGLGEIGLDPWYFTGSSPSGLRERSQVLGHEMGHALGTSNESLADVIGNQWRDYYSMNRDKRDRRKVNLGPSSGVIKAK